jgi:hypothetical protein
VPARPVVHHQGSDPPRDVQRDRRERLLARLPFATVHPALAPPPRLHEAACSLTPVLGSETTWWILACESMMQDPNVQELIHAWEHKDRAEEARSLLHRSSRCGRSG